jgi:hypothetical protein
MNFKLKNYVLVQDKEGLKEAYGRAQGGWQQPQTEKSVQLRHVEEVTVATRPP